METIKLRNGNIIPLAKTGIYACGVSQKTEVASAKPDTVKQEISKACRFIQVFVSSSMDIKLANQDKNIVAMIWLLEIVLRSIVNGTKASPTKIPEHKKKMYAEIAELFRDAYEKAKQLNKEFDDQIKKVFDDSFQDTLADLTLSVVTLYETMTPKQLLLFMRQAGITNGLIVETFKNGDNDGQTAMPDMQA